MEKVIEFTENPTQEQLEIQSKHNDLCNEWLYDADGITVYACCEDGMVKISNK